VKNVDDIDEITYLQFLDVFCIHCNDLIVIFVFFNLCVVWFINFFCKFFFVYILED